MKQEIEEIIKRNLPEEEEYTGFCDKTGTKIYSGDWLEFISQYEGEQIWVGQVIFEDGVWTIDITNKKIIKHSKKWSEKYPDRDWTNTRAWACDVGYGEYGSWNDRRKSISEIAGYFKSPDEMFKVRNLFNKKYGEFHSNYNLERELPVLIVKGEKKESNYKKHSTGFNQALSQINTSLIADEVLKVVVEKIKELPVYQEKYKDKSIGSPKIEKSDILRLLSNLSPNKENKN